MAITQNLYLYISDFEDIIKSCLALIINFN